MRSPQRKIPEKNTGQKYIRNFCFAHGCKNGFLLPKKQIKNTFKSQPLKANWKILELSPFGRKKSNRTKQGLSYRFAQITRKAVEEWLKKTSQRPRKILYPKYCHPRINLSVCYISRWCFPVAFKIIWHAALPLRCDTVKMVPSYPTDHLCMDFQSHLCFHEDFICLSAWLCCSFSGILRELSTALESSCHQRTTLGWSISGTAQGPGPSSGRCSQWPQSSRAKWHCQVQVLGAAEQPQGLQTDTTGTFSLWGRQREAQRETRAAFALLNWKMSSVSQATAPCRGTILLQTQGLTERAFNQV